MTIEVQSASGPTRYIVVVNDGRRSLTVHETAGFALDGDFTSDSCSKLSTVQRREANEFAVELGRMVGHNVVRYSETFVRLDETYGEDDMWAGALAVMETVCTDYDQAMRAEVDDDTADRINIAVGEERAATLRATGSGVNDADNYYMTVFNDAARESWKGTH